MVIDWVTVFMGKCCGKEEEILDGADGGIYRILEMSQRFTDGVVCQAYVGSLAWKGLAPNERMTFGDGEVAGVWMRWMGWED